MLRAALAVLLLSAAPAFAQDVGVEDSYAISPVPGAPTGAAYMLIHNSASEPDRLVEVRSPAASSVALHHHVEEDGVMRMRPVEGGLALEAGSDLLLERGGAHVMFMGLTGPWEDGDVIPLTLVFEKAGEIAVEVPVDMARLTEAAPSGEAHDHGEAAHSHEDDAAHSHGEGGQTHSH